MAGTHENAYAQFIRIPYRPNIFNGKYARYNLFTNGNDSITDNVLWNPRPSVKKAIDDSGDFRTVPEDETFFTDSSALNEPSVTNEFRNAALAGTAPNFGNWTFLGDPTKVSTVGAINGFNVQRFDATVGDRNFIYQAIGTALTNSMSILLQDCKIEPRYAMSTGTAADLYSYYFNEVLVQPDDLIEGSGLLDMRISSWDGSGNRLLRFGCGTESGVNVPDPSYFIEVLAPQAERSTVATSRVLTTNAPAIRAVDEAQVATSNVFTDNGNFFGGHTAGGFINGVNTTNKTITYFAPSSSPELRGKYFTNTPAGLVGAVVQADNGALIKLINQQGTIQTFSYDVINGTDQQIQSGFEYPNKSTIHFAPSSLDNAATKQLRAGVGDMPPTITGTNLRYFPVATGVTVTGNKQLEINGTYAFDEDLVAIEVETVDIRSGDAIIISLDADIRAGEITLAVLGEDVVLTQGVNELVVYSGIDIPIGNTTNVLHASVAGLTDASIVLGAVEVRRWLDFPVNDFKLSGRHQVLIDAVDMPNFAALWQSALDNQNRMWMYIHNVNPDIVQVQWITAGAFFNVNVTLPASIVAGDILDWEAINNGDDFTLNVNGVSNTTSSTTATTTWGNAMRLEAKFANKVSLIEMEDL